MSLVALVCWAPMAEAAETLSSQDLLTLGRVEHFSQRRQWEAAAAELGRLPKSAQESQAAKGYLRTVLPHLYMPTPPRPSAPSLATAPARKPPTSRLPRMTAQSRVSHRHLDAEANADQIFDERGWQYNNLWMAEEDYGGWRHVLRGSVDGYQDGENDLRPRHLSYQVRRDDARVTVGDIRNYLTPRNPSNPLADHTGYTLRSTQLRGIDLQLSTERNQLHLMAGGAPFFLSPSDEYIYPRTIFGVHDSYAFTPWYRAGVGTSYVRDDDERTGHINAAIQPRETAILAFEQVLKPIPGHWEISAENAYSVTDDNLRPNRFGENAKLKDAAHSVRSEWRWPAIRVLGAYERVGPDFRSPSDIAAIGTINNKGVSTDREHLTLRAYPRRFGPLFGNLLYARTENDLDDDDVVEMTREHWITAQGGLQVPSRWPQPGGRATFIRTTSVPGNRFNAAARWVYDLSGDLRTHWQGIHWTGGYQYLQTANDDRTGFDDEYRRTASLQAGRPLWPGGYLSTRLARTRAQDLFNNATLRSHTEREAHVTVSSRLWSTASLSAGYTYQDRGATLVVDPALQTAAGGVIQTVSSAFAWPVTKRLRQGRTLTLAPSLHFHYADASDDLQQHPAVGARMTARYAVPNAWRWEFMLEHRQDDDQEIARVRSQEWRAWLLLTTRFGGPAQADDSPFR